MTEQPKKQDELRIEDYVWTVQDVADKLGYYYQHVRLLARTDKLPAIKRGRQWFFSEREVMAFLREQTAITVRRTKAELESENHDSEAGDNKECDLLL